MTLEQLILLTRAAFVSVGLLPPESHEMSRGRAILRMSVNGRVVGSVTVPTSLLGVSEEAAAAAIHALVLEAATEAMQEPATRA